MQHCKGCNTNYPDIVYFSEDMLCFKCNSINKLNDFKKWNLTLEKWENIKVKKKGNANRMF